MGIQHQLNGADTPPILPEFLANLAKSDPEAPWASVPVSPDLKHGWHTLTFGDLAHAVDGMARWVEETFGAGDGTLTAAYIGMNDVRYAAAFLGLMKAGYKTLLPSPRNSKEGQAGLLHACKCETLIHSEGVDAAVDTIKASKSALKSCLMPSFDELRQRGVNSGPYKSRCRNDENESVVILHTSGSTGLPKPIYLTHGFIACIWHLRTLPCPVGRISVADVFLSSNEMLTMSPSFHLFGFAVLLRSIFCKGPLVLLPPQKPANAQLIIDILQQRQISVGAFAPSMLEQISSSDEGLRALGKLDYIVYGGAPLAHESGDLINKYTRLMPAIGSTEAGLVANLLPESKDDWDYFEWAECAGVVMEASGEGLYEKVIKPASRKYRAVFHTFPELQEWRTKDLFAPHPKKPGLWLYQGRKDDVLVLSNGEKVNPVGFEKTIESHPLIKGALVVGAGRFQTGLILEPEWETLPKGQTPEGLLDTVWPQIEEANAVSPAHGQVWRQKVAIAKKDKPFRRAPKGSIMRRMTVDLYRPEIEALYSNEASDEQIGKLDPGAEMHEVRETVIKVLKLAGVGLPDDAPGDADVFSYGTDSLQVLAVSSKLSHALSTKEKKVSVSPRIIYSNPTLDGIAMSLTGHGHQGSNNGTRTSREERMSKMAEKYTHDLPAASTPSLLPLPQQHTVILTGSTGSLGNYVLQEILASPRVAKVYCLNRSANAESRQRDSFERRGVAADFGKVAFLHTDFSKSHFGLSEETYSELLETADIFIHNAWAVDFNLALESYEPVHIAGTRRCVDFSIQSKHRAHVVFISSVASVGNWSAIYPDQAEVPERMLFDNSLPFAQGYGESKHVASLILAAAAERSSVPCTIARAGQLAGPSSGDSEWNKHEWLPSIVISSKAMGAMPQDLGNQNVVDWVPMDLAGKTVWEVAQSDLEGSRGEGNLLKAAHVVNPSTVTWNDLVPTIRSTLQQHSKEEVRAVPFKDWVGQLEKTEPTPQEVGQKPALKLIDFYKGLLGTEGGLPRLETRETAQRSQTINGMGPVNSDMMKKWMEMWWA